MNESTLIAEVEKFLERIRHNKKDTDKIHDFKNYIKFYSYLKGNLEKLQEFRETMEIRGYKAPYRSLTRYSRAPLGEVKVEDVQDATHHAQYFRMKATAKKNILDRVKSSISSHKIAIGHLEELVIVKCESCEKKFKGHEIADITTKTCSCGSNNLKIYENLNGVCRVELIKYLPLSGEYMVKMSELSPLSREAFKKIVRILKHEKRGVIKTISLVIRSFEGGRWIRRRVTVDFKERINYEKEIRKKYGPNVRIEFLQFHRKKPAIINDKNVRTALSLAYVKLAEEFAREIFDDLQKKIIINEEKMKIYDKAVKTADERLDITGRDSEDKKELKKELLNDILIKNHLMDKKGSLDEELIRDIETKRKLEKKLYIQMPKVLIIWDILKYYLTTSYDRRSKYSGPFPNLRPNLDTNQTKVFNMDESITKILREYKHEKIEYIPDIKKVLTKKFEIEKRMKGLHVKVNPPAFGASILNISAHLSLEESANLFSVTPKQVQEERKKIDTFGKPISKKAKKFLDMIKR
ncbi:MAG: DUF530 domain-containing protein [Euryarchaeota archaeon]|nr:DUF530 domain-containing protein [Euryarchaeota archaeon]